MMSGKGWMPPGGDAFQKSVSRERCLLRIDAHELEDRRSSGYRDNRRKTALGHPKLCTTRNKLIKNLLFVLGCCMLQIIERLPPSPLSPGQLNLGPVLGLVLGSSQRLAPLEADLLNQRGQSLVGLEAVAQNQSKGPGDIHHRIRNRRLQAKHNSC